jgi:serine/threonine protein kinase
MIKNIRYDERCDLWSLGVTLYELYFWKLPYGENVNSSTIKKYIYDEKNFIFKKTNIPTLDILFKRLLVIDPKYRMAFNEFFNYVFSPDFMKEGVIFVNNNLNYKNIYSEILQEMKNAKENKYDINMSDL